MHGAIVFSGATASLRGSARFAGVAVGKFGLRALAQSMARELGPKGIRVAHVVIDGQIDTPRVRAHLTERDPKTFLDPAAITGACASHPSVMEAVHGSQKSTPSPARRGQVAAAVRKARRSRQAWSATTRSLAEGSGSRTASASCVGRRRQGAWASPARARQT